LVVAEELPGDELGDLLFVVLDGERKSKDATDLSNGERWSVFLLGAAPAPETRARAW